MNDLAEICERLRPGQQSASHPHLRDHAILNLRDHLLVRNDGFRAPVLLKTGDAFSHRTANTSIKPIPIHPFEKHFCATSESDLKRYLAHSFWRHIHVATVQDDA